MTLIDKHILTILIFFPLLGALVVALLPRHKSDLIKGVTLLLALIEMAFSFHLAWHFRNFGYFEFSYGLTQSEITPWIQAWNIYYRVGVDGVSLVLILMSTITLPIALLGTWNSVTKNLKSYSICLLALLSGMVGVFAVLDLFLFYVFWEVMLLPMYFLIGMWGGENRVYASIKFFLYTMLGSVLMLIAIVYMSQAAGGTFNILEHQNFTYPFHVQKWLFWAFVFAFAIKVPMFPVHTWLPDAHVQAPTVGSVILAGVLLKMGVYGFYRLAMPLFPQALLYYQDWLMLIAALGVVYGALVAMVQPDMKKLVAYSSVSHMGVVMLGVLSLTPEGLSGGLIQMVNHGVSTGALFLLIGMIYDRTHTRRIADYSGLAKRMPVYAFFFLVVTFSSIGVPLTNGFVGEFLSLLGGFRAHAGSGVVAATGVVLGAVYMLWLVQRVFFGKEKEIHGSEHDLNRREIFVMTLAFIFILWLGVFPKPVLEKLSNSSQSLISLFRPDNLQLREMILDRPPSSQLSPVSTERVWQLPSSLFADVKGDR